MKQKTLLILLLLVGAMTAVIWFWKPAPLPENAGKLFTDNVTEIRLKRPQQEIVLKKSGERWVLAQPIAFKAAVGPVDQMLSEIDMARKDKTLGKSDQQGSHKPLSEYGLDAPRLTLTVAGTNTSTTLSLGKESPVGGFVYAKREGSDDVFVVPKSLFEAVDRSVDELRDRTLAELISFQVSRIEIKETGNVELQRKPQRWFITRPITARAASQKVDTLLDELRLPQISDFVGGDTTNLKPYGLDEPSGEFSMWSTTDSPPWVLQIGSPVKDHPDKTYAKRKGEDVVFTISSELAARLKSQVKDLRELLVFSFDVDPLKAIVSIEVVTPKGTTRLVRETVEPDPMSEMSGRPRREMYRWIEKEPKEAPADSHVMIVFLDNVTGMRIKEFVEDVITDLSKFGLDKPSAIITLYPEPKTPPASKVTAGGTATGAASAPEPLGRLLLGAVHVDKDDPAKNLLYVKREDEPFVYGVDPSLVDRINTSALGFRNRDIITVSPDDIQSLVIQRGEQVLRYEKDKDHKWQFPPGQAGILDQTRFGLALGTLATLRAEQLTTDKTDNLADFGLNAPEMIVSFDVRPPVKPGQAAAAAPATTKYELRIGKESPLRRHYAVVVGQSLVFEMDNPTYNMLSTLSAKSASPTP